MGGPAGALVRIEDPFGVYLKVEPV